MGLVKAIGRAMQPQHAQARSNSTIAGIGLKTSAGSIEAIAKGGIKNSGSMASIVTLIGGKRIDQKKADSVSSRMGAIKHDAAMLKAVEPQIIAGANAYVAAETSRANIVKAVAGATQKVAVLNAETQAKTFIGHVQSHSRVVYEQATQHGDYAL